ncbi:MAG TPA: serine/threonine-protein kinase [Polyangiaceae bacterium]|nr:serine/threonine-protein kinase [Polyangiaceae bacterium]
MTDDDIDPGGTPATDGQPVAAVSAPASSGHKVVTVSPPPDSMSDTEPPVPGGERVRDPYLGFTVDDRYKLESVIGEGGMGIVYRCRHTIIDKKVAMKVLRADLARDEEVTERFLNEARAASAVGNPHIIDISDFGRFPDGSAYFVMEHLDGIPLTRLVADGAAVPVPRLLHIALQLAEGLAAAHQAGIVHRDLKPDNVFLVPLGKEQDFVKILDFGIAKVSTQGSRLTRAGTVFGTPHYMSPEQAAGAPVDHRGDVYSLGVILYELASGRVPFDADNFMGILTQHMYKAPIPIRALVPAPPDVPPGLEAIVLKCLSKRPEQRYQSMEELLEDLGRLAEGGVPKAVGEMMSRSGGFSVPTNYFAVGTNAMPAPIPGAPPAGPVQPRWSLYVGIALALFAVGLLATILGMTLTGPAPSAAVVAAAPLPATTPGASVAPTMVVAPSSAFAGRQVLVATVPAVAEVFVGDRRLGPAPVAIEVAPGQAVELTARAPGYRPQTERVDGSREAVVITLARDPGAARGARAAGRPSATATQPRARPDAGALGGGDIVNPWAP